MTLAWHEVRTLEPMQFPAYEETLLSRAAQNETVLGFVRLARCVLIGALDDPHRALRLSYIGTRFPVVRRRTGGGSLSLDPGTLMLVAAFPSSFKATHQLADLIESLCAPLVSVIRDYGIDAQFTAPNDIVSAGRKIASAFIARGRDGLLFEVALSLSLDIEEMLKILRLPLEKLSEKGLLAARQRFAPLQISVPGLRPSVLRSRIVSACARPPCRRSPRTASVIMGSRGRRRLRPTGGRRCFGFSEDPRRRALS